MNGNFVEPGVDRSGDLRRARRRMLAAGAAVLAFAVVAIAAIATSVYTGQDAAVAIAIVAIVATVCFAAWGGRAWYSLSLLDQRTALRSGTPE